MSQDHLIIAGASPAFKDWVRRVGKEGDQTSVEFLIDVSLERLINNDKAVKLLAEAAMAGMDWQESVLDRDQNDPTGLDTLGNRYIIAAGGVGDWATHDDDIAEYDGVAWVFTTPNKGFAAYVEDELVQVVFNGAVWVTAGGGADHGALAGLGDDDHTQYLLEDGSRALSGDVDMGTNAITNVGNVDGVDISAHRLGDAKVQHTGGVGDHDHNSAGAEGGKFNHANLNGLGIDDHTQYLLASGTRSMSGGLDMGTNAITNVGNVDGVDISTLDTNFGTHDGGDAKAQHTGGLGTHTHATAGAEGGQLDHGSGMVPASLLDDDHTQYTLVAGTRAFTGNQTFNTGIHHVVTWFISGAIGVAADQFAFVVPDDFAGYTFDGARIYALTAPTDASLIVDVHKGGVTFYTTQGNRPTIAAAANDSGDRTAPDITAIAKGDIITVDVDQVGSTIAGSNLAITLVFVQAAA